MGLIKQDSMTDYRDWECEPHTVGHDDQWLIGKRDYGGKYGE